PRSLRQTLPEQSRRGGDFDFAPTHVIPTPERPHPLSFRRASEARQEEPAVRRLQIKCSQPAKRKKKVTAGCPISRVLCEKACPERSRRVGIFALRAPDPPITA